MVTGVDKVIETVTERIRSKNLVPFGQYHKNRLFRSCRDDFSPTVEAIRSYMVAKVSLTTRGINRQRDTAQGIVGTAHPSPGSGFSILLNSHKVISSSMGFIWFSATGFMADQHCEGAVSRYKFLAEIIFMEQNRAIGLFMFWYLRQYQ